MKSKLTQLKQTILAMVASAAAVSSAHADTSLLTFDSPPGLSTDSPYGAWSGAGFTFGTTSYDVNVAAGGWGGQFISITPFVNASGNTAIQLKVNVTTTGSAAAILTLGDADGTEQIYDWYGLTNGAHVVTKSLDGYSSIGAAGTTPGLDLTNLAYVHIAGNGDPYTIQWQDLRLTGSYSTAAVGQTVLVDFGSDTSFRGVSVVNPDVNGNYWNSVQPGAYVANLIDTSNGATIIDIGFDTPVGTDSYNGPAGATSIPPTASEIAATDIDAGALGILGVTNAAFDFASGTDVRFQIQELDPAKKYNLTFFGSRRFTSESNTVYSVYSDNTYTTNNLLIGQTNLNLYQPGSPWLNNRNKTATLNNLTPPVDGILYVRFTGANGGSGSLNSLQISEVAAPLITVQSYNVGTNSFTLTWTSAPGKIYSILHSTNLSSGFTTILTGVNSGGSSTTATVTMPVSGTGFLRVQQE